MTSIRLVCSVVMVALASTVSFAASAATPATAHGPLEAFLAFDPHNGGDLFVAPASDPVKRGHELTPKVDMDGATISPDGHHIAEQDTTTKDRRSLVVGDQNGQHRRLVWQGAKGSTSAEIDGTAWSPDGRKLFYSVLRRAATTAGTTTARLFVATVTKTGPIRSTPVHGGRRLIDPSVSPKGNKLAAILVTWDPETSDETGSALVVLNLSNGHVSRPLYSFSDQMSANGETLTFPAWSPGGALIAVQNTHPLNSGDSPSGEIDVFKANSSNRGEPIVAFNGNQTRYTDEPVWRSHDKLWYYSAGLGRHPNGGYYSVTLHTPSDSFSEPVRVASGIFDPTFTR